MRTSNAQVHALVLILALSLPAVAILAATPQNDPPSPKSSASKTAAPVSPGTQAVATDESAAAKLPVRRVVLYKSGVGYFEHVGHVRGDQTVRIDFTSGQLNDVLQSLTILDLSGGRIAGVNYNSEAPLSQRLGALRLPLEEKTDLSQFYGALRGTRLEVRSGTNVITGRLLSVERKTRTSGGTTLEVDLATLVSDSGEVHSVEITPAVSVRLAERDVSEEVGRYLSLLGSVRQQDLRRMTISTAGTGDRQLYVSYISEVPIWKTTYRVVLPSKPGEEPLLQGWAIVDNTVGEDWNNVELSLVAGAPQSFIQQLSQAYYARRPIVPLPQNMQLTPQTHEGAMLGGLAGLSGTVTDPTGATIPNAQVKLLTASGEVVASMPAGNQGQFSFDNLPAANYRLEVTQPGFSTSVVQGLSLGGGRAVTQNVTLSLGSNTQSVTVTASSSSLQTESSNMATGDAESMTGPVGSGGELGTGRGVGRATGSGSGGGIGYGYGVAGGAGGGIIGGSLNKMEAAAQGSELGDLFEYKLKDRVTIHKNESSLVPIVQAHVAVEKVSLWNASLGSPRPLRALWLTNSSPLTLDSGSFTVLEDETYAGEGLTEAFKPGEKKLLSYAADLGLRVDAKSENDAQRVTRVRIIHGVMMQTSEMRQDTTYLIRDDDATPRTLLIEHPLRAGWKIADDGPKPEETTSNVYRFRISIEPKVSTSFSIRESEPIEARYELTNLNDNQINLFLAQKSINPEVEGALRKIVEQKNRVAAIDAEISRRDDDTKKIYDDQQRLRENLKALKGSQEERALTQRYTQQLADQETRLENLQRESVDFQARRDQAQSELEKMIENLTMDTAI